MATRTFFKLIPAVHLLLFKDKRVLLLRRFNTGYEDGNYSVPAGHVDGQETARHAMLREAREEIGIKIKITDLELVHIMHRTKASEKEERVDFFFTAQRWRGKPTICEPNKCDQLQWARVDQLPDNVVDYITAAIEAVQSGQIYSEFGW